MLRFPRINLAKQKCRFFEFLHFIKVRQIGIMLSIMMMFLCFVMFSWGVAFWSNGLYSTNFDLGSCWQGITVVATGLITVATFASMEYVEKWIDSKYKVEETEKKIHKKPNRKQDTNEK